MNATGIVRRVDDLGRVVLPMELRRSLDINGGDPMEMWVDGSDIVLRKYQTGCVFCGAPTKNTFMEKHVCEKCMRELTVKCRDVKKIVDTK